MKLNFKDTHSYVYEKDHDGNEVVIYFKAWQGMKSNDPHYVPDTPPEVEVWGITVRGPEGDEVRIDVFDFAENFDYDRIENYIYANLDTLIS